MLEKKKILKSTKKKGGGVDKERTLETFKDKTFLENHLFLRFPRF